MLDEFISENANEIIRRARARVAERRAPRASQHEIELGVPHFLLQLTALVKDMLAHSDENAARVVVATAAEAHARESWRGGASIGQVVHDYGDICQVVTELAVERSVAISAAEFRCFNRCLDDAIARAVGEYQRVRDASAAIDGAERLGVFAHELRDVISTSMLSWDSVKRGVTPTGGSVGAMLTRSLGRLRDLVDRSLTQVRLEEASIARERISVAGFIEEEEIAAIIEARAHGIELSVAPVAAELFVDADRQLLAAALASLVQNAFKFTRPDTLVAIRVNGTESRVYIDVEDECGGLSPGKMDEIFRPFEPRGRSRTGVGLGLSIARRAVEANGGEVRLHNLPHKGCRFTIDLPRSSATNTLD